MILPWNMNQRMIKCEFRLISWIYKFLVFYEYHSIFRSQTEIDDLIALHIGSDTMPIESDTTTQIYPLYPFNSIELGVLFVYGKDFERTIDILVIPKSLKLVSILVSCFISLAVIILYIIRNKFKLRRNGGSSVIIDCMIAFINGGNLQMRHKFEKWFFGILIFGAFFMTALLTGDILDCIYQNRAHKISKFDEINDLKIPVFISRHLKIHEDLIHEMLRFDLLDYKRNHLKCFEN